MLGENNNVRKFISKAKELIYNDFNERAKVALITYKLKQLLDNRELNVKELKKELALSIY